MTGRRICSPPSPRRAAALPARAAIQILAVLLLASTLAWPTPIPPPSGGGTRDRRTAPHASPAEAPAEGGPELFGAATLSPAAILNRASPAVVVVISVLPSEGVVRGAGFFGDASGLVVTSYHLVDHAKDIRIKTRSGHIYRRVRVLAEKPAADLALLEIVDLQGSQSWLPLADPTNLRVGDPVVAIGHPLGLEYTLSLGLVSALRTSSARNLDLIQFSAPASAGCSGGPLINGTGQVIGVVSLSHPEGQNLNFAVPVRYVQPMLARNNRGSSLAALLGGLDRESTSHEGRSGQRHAQRVPLGVDLIPTTPQGTDTEAVSRRTFRCSGKASLERGFEIQCPTSWTSSSQRLPDSVNAKLASPDGLVHIDIATVSVTGGITADRWVHESMRRVNSAAMSSAAPPGHEPREPRLVRQTTQTLGGTTWTMYVHRFTDDDGNDDYAVTMLALREGRGYLLRYAAPISVWSRVRSTIERVVSSARVF